MLAAIDLLKAKQQQDKVTNPPGFFRTILDNPGGYMIKKNSAGDYTSRTQRERDSLKEQAACDKAEIESQKAKYAAARSTPAPKTAAMLRELKGGAV